jgi:hypothetical protein
MSNLPQAGRSSHRIVRRFAALCEKAVVAPTASRFLAAYPKATCRQRVDVMLVDMARCWSKGTLMTVEEYLTADEEIAADRELTLELITAEFDIRDQLDLEPTIDEYIERFETLEEPIRAALSQRDDTGQLPLYPQLAKHLLVDGLSPGTVWGGRKSNWTGFDVQLSATGQSVHESLLAECRPFSLLPAPVVRLIESNMEIRSFEAGEFLIQQDTPGTSLIVLCDGEVEISTSDDQGNRRVLTRTSHVQVLGEMALLTRQPRNADVVALATVRALVLPAEQFHELAGRYPEISEVLTLMLAERLGVPGRDDVLAGKTLDSYRICSRLGRGGMAVVYEARHIDSDQHVALKMMSHRLVYDRDALDQFQAEADIIQSFDHENIVKLFGRFSAFHTYFIVMEFADGILLREYINRCGVVPVDEFRKSFGQIAKALNYAHQAGIIHRDVKPANIMVTRDGVIKLMDFGLATPAIGTSPANNRVVGTPRYMAPEQLVGGRLTTAADLFSLGCVGYEMLTGKVLNDDENVIELLRRHSNWEVPNIRSAFPQLDAEVCSVVEQCLQEDPDERRLDFDMVSNWAEPIETSMLSQQNE